MRDLLLRIWALPWPARIRRLAEPVIMNRLVQRLAIPHFRVGVVAVVQNEDHEYLLFRHTYRNAYPWGLPTGFIEHGEQPAAALAREIEEESGLAVSLDRVWDIYVAPRDVVNVVFRGRVTGGTFRPSLEITEMRYVPAADIPPLMYGQGELILACELEARDKEPA